MPKVSKFTKEQKLEIALELISGKLSHNEVCRKHGISSTYAYRLKDRALELLRQGIDHAVEKPSGREKKWSLGRASLRDKGGGFQAFPELSGGFV